jgi:hypothetical protein
MEQEERRQGLQFTIKYIMYPIELQKDKRLAPVDREVWSAVHMLDHPEKHCWAKNTSIAECLNINDTTVSKSINTLIECGYIKMISFDGRRRVISCDMEAIYAESQRLRQTAESELAGEGWPNAQPRLGQMPKSNLADRPTRVVRVEDYNGKSKSLSAEKTAELGIGDSQTSHQISDKALAIMNAKMKMGKSYDDYMPSEDVQYLITVWNELGLTQHKFNTKNAYDIQEKYNSLMAGKLIKGYKPSSRDIVEQAIGNFALAATNPDYLPYDKKFLKKLTLSNFLWDDYSNASHYTDFTRLPALMPKKDRIIKDDYPDITRDLKKRYIHNVLGGVAPKAFDVVDENKFRNAARGLSSWINRNRKKFSDWVRDEDMTEYFFKALEDDINGDWSILTPGWLSSEKMFEIRLPRYMCSQAMFKDEASEEWLANNGGYDMSFDGGYTEHREYL